MTGYRRCGAIPAFAGMTIKSGAIQIALNCCKKCNGCVAVLFFPGVSRSCCKIPNDCRHSSSESNCQGILDSCPRNPFHAFFPFADAPLPAAGDFAATAFRSVALRNGVLDANGALGASIKTIALDAAVPCSCNAR